jgi:phage terminase large subunit
VRSRPEQTFDFRNPDYGPIFQARVQRLAKIRENPDMLPGLFAYYRENPWDFISDWGMTYAPKANDGQHIVRPMVLFPKQVEWLKWVVDLWKTQQRGLTEKSRESGVTWLAVSLGATLCLFRKDLTIGYGANLVELVDNLGDMDSILEKGRFFLDHLPDDFTGGWTSADSQYSKEKLLRFPLTGSRMKGQGGDNIGRGGRASLYFVDEFAHIQRAKGVDQALSANTDTQIDISTVKGLANAFAEKRHSGRVPVFTFHWRDDPRKDEAWYAKQLAQFDPVLVAQEIDINYSASVEGVLIPSEWVQAAINADQKLGFTVSGARRAALDVADEGRDKNALAIGHGICVEQVPEWSGKGSDILGTVQRAFALCDEAGVTDMRFDSDGLGAGVRGDARVLNEGREVKIGVNPWRGSGKVAFPDKPIPSANPTGRKDRTNGDFFANAKAQGWWELRVRFQRTHRAVTEPDYKYDPDDLIVLREGLGGLYSELSQPTYTVNTAGKIIVDKQPDGTPSPNKADAVMILIAPRQGGAYDLGAAL